MKINFYLLLGFSLALNLTRPAAASSDYEWPPKSVPKFVRDACTKQERWYNDAKLEDSAKSPISTSDLSSAAIFALVKRQGSTVQTTPDAARLQAFSLLLRGMILQERELPHLAFHFYSELISLSTSIDNVGYQLGALQCLGQLQGKLPSLRINPEQRAKILGIAPLLKELGAHSALQSAPAIVITKDLLMPARELPAPNAELSALLLEYPPANYLLTGHLALSRKDFVGAVNSFQNFLSSKKKDAFTVENSSKAWAALGRAWLAQENWQNAITAYESVPKDSNEITRVLNELAWAKFMAQQYDQAIGTAMELTRGGFQDVYTPEAYTIIAMIFNDLCQFPAALAAVRTLRDLYRETFIWIRDWHRDRSKFPALYSLALDAAERKPNKVPTQISNEWIRSPTFITHQQELNLLLTEDRRISRLKVEIKKEARKVLAEFAAAKKEYTEELRDAKKSANQKIIVDEDLRKAHKAALESRRIYTAFLETIKELDSLQAKQNRLRRPLQTRIIDVLERDLQLKNRRMLAKLQETAQKIYLIEIEILNGASQDVVWKTAHPNYEAFVAKAKQEQRNQEQAKTWDWGRRPLFSKGRQEVWSDELGTLRALVFDNCANKDRYTEVNLNADFSAPVETESAKE